MRKLTFSLAAAASALILAAPAAAQQWGTPPPGYGAPYGNAFGLDNRGQARALLVRAQQLRDRIHNLHANSRLTNREARRLHRHATQLQRRIRVAASNGLTWRERQEVEQRLNALREAVRYETRDGNRWGWDGSNDRGNRYGYYGERRDDDRGLDRDHDDDRDGDRRGRRGRDSDD